MKTIIILSLLLAGCATPPEIIEGNSESVIVNWGNTWSPDGALAVADQHCSKYGKKARYHTGQSAFRMAYDCVKD